MERSPATSAAEGVEGSVPLGGSIRTPEEAADALGTDPRFAGFQVRSLSVTVGDRYVEIDLANGDLTLAWPDLWQDRAKLASHLLRARSGYSPLLLLGTDDEFESFGTDSLRDQGDVTLVGLPIGRERLAVLLRNHREMCRLRRTAAEGEIETDRYQYEIEELSTIGRALSSQRNIGKLLALILEKAREVTGADAGSVYVVEGGDEDARRTLRFKVSQNDSVKLDLTEFTLPVSAQSIVGRCVLSREVLNLADLYSLDEPGTGNNPWGFKHNRAFDEKIRYQTRSMLTVPMIDAGNRVIGVIQLINKKRRREEPLASAADFDTKVIPFDARSQNLAATLAAQAGISLENALLYDEIRDLFEGFVHASVTAIESRDPTTSGHSQRVADLTIALAEATDRTTTGPFTDYHCNWDELKQIEYAALLHDFGKVGVRENVLVKAKKLYDHDRDLILARFDYIKKDLEAEAHRKKVHLLMTAPSRDEAVHQIGLLDEEYAGRVREIDEYVSFVLKANEPTVLEQGGFERLADIAKRTYKDGRGEEHPFLRQTEVETLQILRGSLTVMERMEIESHVSHTYNYLRRIPWGRVYRNIPEYAGSHHEKLDGTGYPRRLKGQQIPVPARMMTISDIYDALTASDRPYKRAVPRDKALDIIGFEVKQGKVDSDLFQIFIEAQVWEKVTPG
jgi:HD-GYP domain-containing protein (c-di-GMP phosphodiesterase class II)